LFCASDKVNNLLGLNQFKRYEDKITFDIIPIAKIKPRAIFNFLASLVFHGFCSDNLKIAAIKKIQLWLKSKKHPNVQESSG
jgi:hypothetical protein